RTAGRRSGAAAGGPPVRPERGAHRLQARRLPAQLRLRLRRDALRPAQPLAGRAGDGRRPAGLSTMNARLDPQTVFATPSVESRLPKVGTTIFTVMSALAQQH